MKKAFTLISLLFFIASSAQNDTARSTDNLHLYFGFGAAGQRFGALNSRIATRPEYQTLRKTEFAISLGFTRELDRFMLNYNLGIASSLSGDKTKKSSNMAIFSGSVNFGYNLSNNNKTRIAPFVGFGVETFKATFNKDLSAIPFDSVLQSTSWQQKTLPLSFTNTFFVYRAGLAIDFISKTDSRFATGIRAGYTGSFRTKAWNINEEQSLSNAPADKLSAWFVTVQFMRKIRKHKHA